MKPLISMREALDDPELFGTILPGDSWLPWRVLLIALMGEPLTDDERISFKQLTMRDHEPLEPVEEFWGIVGRRGGKTRAMSVLSAYLAALIDWSDVLVPGEIGKLQYMGYNQRQANIAFEYAKSIFTELPLFAQRVESISADVIELKTGIELEVRAATWRGLRGVTSIGAIFDELAFFQSEEHSANTDKEILNAVRPSLATTSGPLIAISSPFAKMGEVYQAVERDFGPNGDPLILVARGASRTFNPSLSERVVTRALERDAAAARAEFLGEFREDLAAFVDLSVVQACVAAGLAAVLPNALRRPYRAFCDPAGGSGTDSMTLAIGHDGLDDAQLGKDLIVLDKVVEVKPPFKPELIVAQFCETLKSYGLNEVWGDNYAAGWVVDAFDRYGVRYWKSPLNKSELFLNFLPMLNSRSVQLLDHAKMVSQLVGMQRRVTSGGREVIDHNPNGHDDVANAVAGCLAIIARARRQTKTATKAIPM
ncbi:hypothetical protein EJ066_26260 [Mesorhizobium sp. M9A.F.Ca.ET.002.03.1.2]|uniref:hypothetical protein n=1 Tax=Mesorhizobium sp. M9A.F.Ca.ET.002.03.1.2 TaxID=2493668 RepID=UPI000F756D7B|nr:hypothetical protein [Mesorhizobium sp. M9A.F.Ca.ET.002.03.1.2]AZO00347.1 hypothetical protein EJ066_26260 [Mesorhizobium sp. M9A.F.Ca.ET.002.03.1.2]